MMASSTPAVSGWTGSEITEVSTDITISIDKPGTETLKVTCTNSDTGVKYSDTAVATRLADTYVLPDNSGPECQSSLVKPIADQLTTYKNEVNNLTTCNLPADWTGISCRNYDGDLSTPGEFQGLVDCGSEDAASNFRYQLRSYFETNLWRRTGYGAPHVVNIEAFSSGVVAWWVLTCPGTPDVYCGLSAENGWDYSR